MNAPRTALPLQERVEAQGHLIDSHIMEQIFDTVVEYNGRFEVEQFRIGRTNSEPSYLRLKVDTDDAESMQQDSLAVARPGLLHGRFGRRRPRHRRARPLRSRRFLLHHQPPHLRPPQPGMGGSAEPAHGRADRRRRRSGLVPPPARYPRGRPRRHRDARHPRGSRIQGARPPGLRVHEQRHLLRAPGGNRRQADRGADRAGALRRSQDRRRRRTGGCSHRRRQPRLRA